MEKELKINIPEGFEIDKENSTFECIKFKPIKYPKTWEEFCDMYPSTEGNYYIDSHCNIQPCLGERDLVQDRNLVPNLDYARAILALCQLIQLRDCYTNGWVPDWKSDYEKWVIVIRKGDPSIITLSTSQRPLAFESFERCKDFLKNFRALIMLAAPLL